MKKSASQKDEKIEIYGQYGATLTLIEVALGSLLHTFHIPFAGQFLSLNQGYLLCRVSLKSRNLNDCQWMPYGISNIAAVLKSLSPTGKKLGPMLSLSMQGLLFNLGVRLFGVNQFGLIFGMILLSVWTFVQTFLTAYLIFGANLFTALFALAEKTLSFFKLRSDLVLWVLLSVILSKILVATALAILSVRSKKLNDWQDHLIKKSEKKIENWNQFKIKSTSQETEPKKIYALVLLDLISPFFLLSLLLTVIFALFSEAQNSDWVLILLRPLAVGFIFFYLSRTMTIEKHLQKLENGRFHTFAQSCLVIIKKLKK